MKRAIKIPVIILLALAASGIPFVIAAFVRSGAAKAALIALGVIIALAAGGFFALGELAADKVLHQNRGTDIRRNSLDQLDAWGFDTGAFLAAHEGTDLSLTSADGNTFSGTRFSCGSGRCAVLIHGLGGDRTCVYPLANEYLKRGIDVITFDQRGSGVNEDGRITFGIYERLDAAAVVDHAKNVLGMDEVIVHGQSMGAQTAAIYASKAGAANADAVILDSPVPSMEAVLKAAFGRGDPDSIAAKLLYSAGKFCMKHFHGVDPDEADTMELVKTDRIPTLVILSERDEVCLPELVKRVYDNIACVDKALLKVDSAHVEGVIDDPEMYMRGVEDFLEALHGR